METQWSIQEITRRNEDGCIRIVNLKCSVIGGEEVHASGVSVRLDEPSDFFVPYNELDEETVLGWALNSLGEFKKNKYEEMAISNHKTPSSTGESTEIPIWQQQ